MQGTKDSKSSIVKNFLAMSETPSDFPIVAPYPNNIQLELSNACNLQCIMCYNKEIRTKKGMMSFETFKKVIDQAKELGIENVGLYTVGEPFMNRRVFEFIAYAKGQGIKYVYVTTNGQLLDRDKIEKMFDSGLDSIKFSIDAATAESYERIRVGGSWEKLLHNIRTVKRRREERKQPLKVFASFTLQKNNIADLLTYNEVFGGLIDETHFSIVATQGGSYSVIDHLLPDENKRIAAMISETFNIALRPCNLLWNRFVVTWDGNLTICCSDFEADLIYADLSSTTLREAWNNSKMREYRRVHKNLDFGAIPNCDRCDYVRRNGAGEHAIVLDILKLLEEKKPVS